MTFLKNAPKEELAKISQELFELLKSKKLSLRYDEVYEYKDFLKGIERTQKAGKKVILVPNKQ